MAHQLLLCLRIAYVNNRTLLADPVFYRLQDYYLPLSRTCQLEDLPETNSTNRPVDHAEDRIIKLKVGERIWMSGVSQQHMPPTVPESIVHELETVSPDPAVWFSGQLLYYILRPNQKWAAKIDQLRDESLPAAIHVRRSDKKIEVPYAETSLYLEVVQEHFAMKRMLQNGVDDKRLFIATDDLSVLEAVKEDYPDITTISNRSVIRTTSYKGNRVLDSAYNDLMLDIYRLVYADFVACTFTSNVCRLAYKLRLAMRPVFRSVYEVVSVDNDFFEDYDKTYVALHKTITKRPKELDFAKGEIIYHKSWKSRA